MNRRSKLASSAVALAVAAVGAWSVGQQPPPATSPYFQQPAPAVEPPATAPANGPSQPQAAAAPIPPQEIDQLLAPVALYPDALLSQVLMASTYPLEVVQARRFVDANPDLPANTLADMLAAQPWDPSVKSLVNTPTVLRLMDDKLDWTVKLGDAFLAQQRDVMDGVQRLRAQAQQAGYLKTDEERRVTVAPAAPAPLPPQVVVVNGPPEPQPIVIEDTRPDVVYVPVYDPGVVYGTWAYPAYRPFYWRPHNYVSTGVFFYDRPCPVGPAWSYAWGRPDWRNRRVDLDVRDAVLSGRLDSDVTVRRVRERDANRNGPVVWQHDATHRLGVAYRDVRTARQFDPRPGDADVRSRTPNRGRADNNTADDARPTQQRSAGRPDNADRPAARPLVQTDTSPTQAERDRADRAARQQKFADPTPAVRAADPDGKARQADGPRRADTPARQADTPAKDAPAKTADTPPKTPDPSARQRDRGGAFNDAGDGNAARTDADRGARGRPAPQPTAPAQPTPAPRQAAPDRPAPAPTPAPAPAPARREAPPAAPRPAPAPAQPAPAPARGSAPERPAPAPPAPARERAAPAGDNAPAPAPRPAASDAGAGNSGDASRGSSGAHK